MWEQIKEYFQFNMESYLQMLKSHILISLLSLCIAVLVGISAGILVSKHGGMGKWLSGIFQSLRIIPSLAVLLLLIPLVGTGVLPAMIALTVLAIPPIFMNTVSGIGEVEESMLENAKAMGMSKQTMFWRVQMPIAFPMILTGIKTAAVEIVASAALAAKIGAGGFGEIIFTGLGLYRMDFILVGAISVSVLSLGTGLLLDGLGWLLIPWKHKQ